MDHKNKQKSKAGCPVSTILPPEKHRELCTLLKQARGIRTLSALVRHILCNRKIFVVQYDMTMDHIMTELCAARRELALIGLNLRQAKEEAAKGCATSLTGCCRQTELKIEELFTLIEHLSQKWLPE